MQRAGCRRCPWFPCISSLYPPLISATTAGNSSTQTHTQAHSAFCIRAFSEKLGALQSTHNTAQQCRVLPHQGQSSPAGNGEILPSLIPQMGNTEKHPLDVSEVPAESIPTAYGSDLNDTHGSSRLTLPALTPTSCFTSHLKKLLPSPVSGFAFRDSQTKAIDAPAEKKLCINI